MGFDPRPDPRSLEQLASYFLHHGTALYVDYNSNLLNFDPRLPSSDSDLAPARGEFINDSRQLFIKFSYLVRF